MSQFIGQKFKILLSAFLISGAFLFFLAPAQTAQAMNDYNKLFNGTLQSTEWNNLPNDFVRTWGPATMLGPLGINTSTAPASGLYVNGPIEGTNFVGPSTGSIGAGNVTSDEFGANYGGGNYYFGLAGLGSGIVGIGTLDIGARLSVQGTSTNDIFRLFDSSGSQKLTVLSGGNVGIGTTNPTQALEIGTEAAGLNLQLNATLQSDITPTFIAGNWTGTNGWSANGTQLVKVTNATAGTITPSGTTATPVIGETYKITMTCSAKGAAAVTYTYGGVTGTAIVATTFTDYITALSAGKLIITGAINSTATIDAISIQKLTMGTGALYSNGNIRLAGELTGMAGVAGISIGPTGAVGIRGAATIGGALSIVGVLSGATNITYTGALGGTTATLFVPTVNIYQYPSAAPTGITAALIPIQYSPATRQLAYAWNTTGTAISNYTNYRTWIEPYVRVAGTGFIDSRYKWEVAKNTQTEVAHFELMSLGRTGGVDELNVLGLDLADESLVNPGLAGGTNWTANDGGVGGVVLSGDKATYTHNAAQGALSQDNATMTANGGIALKPNRWYRFTYTTSVPVTITVRAYLDETYTSAERIYLPGVTPVAGVGAMQVSFKTNSNPSGFKIKFTSAVGVITFDTFSLKEINSGNIVANGLFTGGGTSGIKIDENGNVGIGTTNLQAKLNINGTLLANSTVTFDLLGGSGTRLVTTDNSGTLGATTTLAGVTMPSGTLGQTLRYGASGWESTSTVFVLNGSNVGIGTTNPGVVDATIGTTVLDVQGTGTLPGQIASRRNVNFVGYGTGFASVLNNSVNNPKIYSYFNGYIIGNTAGAEKGGLAFFTRRAGTPTEAMRILDTGNVGIGTTNPQAKLDLNGTLQANSTITFGLLGSGGTRLVTVDNSGTLGATTTLAGVTMPSGILGQTLRYGASGWESTSTVFVLNGSNVGIGTTAPNNKLEISDTDTTNGHAGLYVSQTGATSGTGYGGYFTKTGLSAGNTGIGLYGSVSGSSSNLGTDIGVKGYAFGSGTNYGGYFTAGDLWAATTATYGIYASVNGYATNQYAVYADATNNGYGNTYGIYQNGSTNVKNYFAGNVGIGTTNPQAKLDLNGTLLTNSTITFSLLGNGGTRLVTVDNSGTLGATTTLAGVTMPSGTLGQTLRYGASGWESTSTVFVQNGSNVGIGTTAPRSKIDVAGSGRFTGTTSFTLTGTADPDGTTTLIGTGTLFTTELVVGDRITVNGETRDVTAIANNTSLTVLIAFTNTAPASITKLPAIFHLYDSTGTPQLVVNNAGQVGIGTGYIYNGWGKLVVNGITGSNGYYINNSLGSTYGILGSAYVGGIGQFNIYGNSTDLVFGTAGVEQMRLKQSGNVGINITNPLSRLAIKGTGDTSTSSALDIQGNDGISHLFVRDDGNVGIGTTNPQAKLDLNGTLQANSTITFGLLGGGGTRLLTTDNSGTLGATTTLAGVTMPTGTLGQTLRYGASGWESTSTVFVLDGSNVGIGTTAPNEKLDIRDGYLGLSSTGVTHSMTAIAPTNTFGLFRNNSADGLFSISGLNEADGTGLTLNGYIGVTNPTDSIPAVIFNSGKYNGGTTGQALADAETAFQFQNYGTAKVTILGNGNVGIGTMNPAYQLQITTSTGGAATGLMLQNTNTSSYANLSFNGTNSQIAETGSGFANGGLIGNTFGHFTNAANGISFMAYNATGMIKLFTGGLAAANERMRIDAGGSVGIGTTNPQAKLDLNGTLLTNSTVSFSLLGGGGMRLVTTDNSGTLGATTTLAGVTMPIGTLGQTLRYGASGWESTSTVFVLNGSNVGIGTTNPTQKLSVDGDIIVDSIAKFGSDASSNAARFEIPALSSSWGKGFYFKGSSFASNSFVLMDISGTALQTSTGGYTGLKVNIVENTIGTGSRKLLDLQKGGTSAFVVEADGNVGIGTTNPQAKLDLNGTLLTNSTVSFSLLGGGGTRLLTTDNSGTLGATSSLAGVTMPTGTLGQTLRYGASGWESTSTVFVLNGSNVGIGMTNPVFKLDVNGIVNATALYVGGVPYIGSQWVTQGSDIYYNLGNVGIGVTNPTAKLDDTGSFKNSLTTTHSALGGAGNVLVMADDNGMLFSTSSAVFISSNSLWGGTKNSDIWNGDAGLGRVGIGTTLPNAKLDVAGDLRIGDTADACDTNKAGTFRYATTSRQTYFCDGVRWLNMKNCGVMTADDGKTYGTVQVGGQCWMTENINIGTMLASGSTEPNTSDNVIQKWCYNNSSANCDAYGGLYNWLEATRGSHTPGARGICPPGWHIPTDAEYNALERTVVGIIASPNTQYPCDFNSVWSPFWYWRRCADDNGQDSGGTYGAGRSLKAIGQGNGDDLVGFNGKFSGARDADGSFQVLDSYLYLWTSSLTEDRAWYRILLSNYSTIDRNMDLQTYGLSVRCLKD